ncbi:MAG TPA: DUF4011 domain-containing protein [Candidatus Onthoplasma faecigallinarum]|nr:DUF4011 domain-containing protein [Candidatus Onthoplasma faecigallinarum]
MKSIYKYYKERLIEISGKNRSLYSRNINKKYSFDIGAVIGGDKEEFEEFFSFLWKGKRTSYALIRKDIKDRLYKNFNIEQKLKPYYKNMNTMSAEEKRDENLRREKMRREENKKLLSSQVNSLKILKREIEEFSKETGRYEMFVGYPFVTGRLNKDMAIKAPLILFPVVINIENDTTVSIEAKHDELIQFNKVLMLAYAKEHRINYDGMMMEFDNLIDYKLKSVDDVLEYLASYGFKFDIDKKFGNTLIKFDKLEEDWTGDYLKIENACVIGRFPLANSIYNDYSLLEKKHLTSLAIDQLIQGKTRKKNKKFDTRTYTINDLDYAQESAINKLNEFGNMVIYGPPGTGKSQTIVNIIADALCKDKRVLVVSQKKAALDVVFNRLKNLNSKCMFITDAEKNKVEFYERCNQMHQAIMSAGRTSENNNDFDTVEQNIQNEVNELKVISDTLFTKTPFGLSLQEMYTNSAKIGKNSFDYVLYKLMKKNKDLMNMDYKRISSTIRIIKEKKKADLYYRYIVLKKNNPLIDHIKSQVDIHVINQMKTYLKEITQKNIVPFDTARHPHARQLLIYMLENGVENIEDMKPLVKMIAQLENKNLCSALKWSKVLFPAYPYFKHKMNKQEQEITANFESTLEEIQQYISQYSLLTKVLDQKGYLMTIDNIINGNSIFLKLLLNALDDYLEIRDVNVSLQGLTDDERIILNFAYGNAKNFKQYKEIIDKILEIRVYHETIKYEELNKDKLSKIIDFENIRNRILSLQKDKKQISANICLNKFRNEYIDYYEHNIENKNYLFQITKQQNLLPIRRMMELYGDFLLKLFPCWLLSPESVSTIFPLKKEMFDIILFDEASQVFIENTLPTIYRGKYIVVAGDSKQLRPTAGFVKRYMGNDSDDELDLATQAALEVESLLDLATSRFHSTNLTYHYRSKNEELINFSNYAFYDGKLQVAPNVTKNVGNKPIERIKVNGSWLGRKNQEEANAVVALLKKLIKNKRNKSSIGIITFNTEQENAIEDAIDNECQKDSAFRDAYIREQNRKDNNEDTSIFIKNLENVQGDERDIIIFSIGYARNEYGKVVAHFGSLSVEGGENRLNVAITRAKEKIYVITSIEPEELIVEGSKNAGPKIFKSYLKYVRAVSNKKNKEAEFVLDSFKPNLPTTDDVVVVNQFENEIKDELTKLGYTVETNLGNTDYKLSIAVYDKSIDRYLLGIECDYAAYKSSDSILERDVYRNKFLQSRGWNIMRVWSRDWWLNKNKVVNNIVKAINEAKKKYSNQ